MDDSYFYDIMFEVSNEERVKILRELTREKTNFSNLARLIGITTQEVSRHFNRLVDSGLTTRGVDGYPVLTPYGLIILRLLSSLNFTTKNREYFETHDASSLPNKFLSRIGELENASYNDDVMVSIHNCIRIIQEAKEYILDINLPYIAHTFPHIKDAYERGVKGWFLRGVNLRVPDEMIHLREENFPDDYLSFIRREKLLMDRYIDANVILYMNESEIALLSFPTLSGKYDYRGFASKDPVAIDWCKDLFYHYWDKAV